MKEALAQACKALHLGYVMAAYESIPFENPTQYLLGVLSAELQGREAARTQRLLKKAGFPQFKTLADYDFRDIVFPGSCTRESLVELTFVDRQENVILIGKVGTGNYRKYLVMERFLESL